MSTSTADLNIDSELKHPKSLWYLSATYVLYNFGFGSILFLLVLYSVQALHFSSKSAYALFAAFNSLFFTLPLVGGYLAEKFGYKNAIYLGGFFCLTGLIILSFTTTLAMYIGLSFFIIGNSLFAPSIYCLVDCIYNKVDKRRESGFTVFYLIFNFGFLAASVVGGYVAQQWSYHYSFLIAAACMFLGIIVLHHSLKIIHPYSGRSIAPQVKLNTPKIILSLLIINCLILIPIFQLLEHVALDNIILIAVAIASSLGVIYLAFQQKEKLARHKLFAFLILIVISVTFWSLYMLEPSLLTIFIHNNVDRNVLGTTIPASTYIGLNPFFIVIVGLFFTWLWRYLSKRGKNISLPTKFASSLLMVGCGYIVLVISIFFAKPDHLVNSVWIILTYIFFSSAELLISPIGLAMVGRLSPKGKEGVLMGMNLLFIGFSAVVSGYLAQMAVVPKTGTALTTNPVYSRVFLEIGCSAIFIGLITVALIPYLKRLINPNR